MKSLLAILLSLCLLEPAMAEDVHNKASEILPSSPPQKILSRYQSDFSFHHDQGFYFSAALGPQWNHSVDKPNAKGMRFGGKVNAGWFVADGFPLFVSAWGNFLEAASLVAVGPGAAVIFDSTNIAVDCSVGVARVFNAVRKREINDFAESVLAANLSVGKFWWLSDKTSLGITISSGIHGLTLSEARLSSFGWNAGLAIAFLLG